MTKIVVTVLLVLGGVGFLAYNSMDSGEFYVHTDKVVGDPNPWMNKDLQVMGFVVPGRLHQSVVDQKAIQDFQIEYEGKRLDVRHAGSVPDTFKVLAQVTVRGRLVEDANHGLVVMAVEGEQGISAKCPSKYNGQR